jgi:hypothetical protein
MLPKPKKEESLFCICDDLGHAKRHNNPLQWYFVFVKINRQKIGIYTKVRYINGWFRHYRKGKEIDEDHYKYR